MKYPEEHKASVGQRLRRQAARQIREKGVAGISVKSVMSAEGMTVGGFYAHFSSKQDLLIEAIKSAFRDSEKRFYKAIEPLDEKKWLGSLVGHYLSHFHRDNIGLSCPISSLMGEISREDNKVKKVFQQGMEQMSEMYAQRVKTLHPNDAEALAIGLFALLSGGIQLSRSVADPEYSDQILQACMTSARKLMGEEIDPESHP